MVTDFFLKNTSRKITTNKTNKHVTVIQTSRKYTPLANRLAFPFVICVLFSIYLAHLHGKPQNEEAHCTMEKELSLVMVNRPIATECEVLSTLYC